MKKLFIFLLSQIVFYSVVFPCDEIQGWNGDWNECVDSDRSIIYKIPFYSDYWEDIIVVHNEKPDRSIFYEIVDEYDNVLIKGSVSKENSAKITILVSDLPDNGIYTIILTSPEPNDWVCSKFKK